MDVNVRIAGEAGQGVQTTGNLLVGAFARAGMHVFSSQSYMSRIRGGMNWFDVRIGDEELFSGRRRADLLVALTGEALEALRGQLAGGGVALFDGSEARGAQALPFTDAARQTGGSAVMANTVAAGAVFTVLGLPLDDLSAHLEVLFKKKDREVVEKNLLCARRGAELAAALAGKVEAPGTGGAPRDVCNAASAVGLAAATAGVKLVTAYPMTPSTAVFAYLAGVAEEYGIVVEQAEDEIAAVNMICGAAYAGVPAMATTSGGGFALMTEGVSLAGMMELPIFILVSQRPGPATGLPTRTAQQDLNLVLHAGHGEFPRAIYAPGTAAQAYELTRRGLQTAHKFQSPAFILTDQYLIDAQTNGAALDRSLRPIDLHVVAEPAGDYVRYAGASSGVSPRAVPGGGALVVCDSDEHDEAGHITEDVRVRVRQQDKRLAKLEPMTAEALPPQLHGPGDAATLMICWGSTYGPCREATDALNAAGLPTGMLHFGQLWPLNVGRAAGEAIARAKRIVCIEGNCTGQFAAILRQQGILSGCELMTRYDGMPFTGEEIVERIRS